MLAHWLCEFGQLTLLLWVSVFHLQMLIITLIGIVRTE